MTRYTCEEIFRRLDDYLDRELTPREMQLVRQHLETCVACSTEFAFEATVLSEVRAKLRRIDVPEDLLGRITARLASARVEDGDRTGDRAPEDR